MRENDDDTPIGDDEAGDETGADETGDAEHDDDETGSEPGGDEPGDEPGSEPGGDEPGSDEPGGDDRDELLAQVELDVSDRAVKARDKALDKEYARHESVLARAWGSLWEQFHVCPLCEGDGFMTMRPPGSMPDEQFAAVYAFAGVAQPVELPPDQDYVCCDNCKGYGNTSIADSQLTGLSKQCDRCLGSGYIKSTAVNVVPITPVIPGPQPPQLVPAPPSYGAPGPPDVYGRPAGHPHYGIPPAAVT